MPMSVFPAYNYVCHLCAWHLQRSEDGVGRFQDPLEPELRIVGSNYHIGAGNSSAISALNCCTASLALGTSLLPTLHVRMMRLRLNN